MHYFTRGALISTSRIIEKIIAFLIIVFASRELGAEEIGVFFYYFGLVSLFIPLMDMGFEKLLLQRWWRIERDQRGRILGKLLTVKLLSGGLALLVVLLTDYFLNGGSANHLAAIAAFIAIFSSEMGELLRQPAHAENIVFVDVLVPIISRLLTLLLFMLFAGEIDKGYQVIYIYAVTNILGTFISLIGLRGYKPVISFKTSPIELWRLAKAGIPFSLTHLFVMTSLYIDTVFIGYFWSMSDVGDYNAAYKVILAIAGLGVGVCYALFPILSGSRQSEDRMILFNQTLRIFVINFGTCMLGGIVLGGLIIDFLYKDEFAGAVSVFKILCVLILVSAVTNLGGQTLEAMGKQKTVMKINLLGALFNVIANLLVIPKFGIQGAAYTTVSTEIIILVAQLWYGRRSDIFKVDFGVLGKALMFLVLIGAFYWNLEWMGEEISAFFGLGYLRLWFALGIGITFFMIVFLGFRRYWLSGGSIKAEG